MFDVLVAVLDNRSCSTFLSTLAILSMTCGLLFFYGFLVGREFGEKVLHIRIFCERPLPPNLGEFILSNCSCRGAFMFSLNPRLEWF